MKKLLLILSSTFMAINLLAWEESLPNSHQRVQSYIYEQIKSVGAINVPLNNGLYRTCTAALIHKKFVITQANCLLTDRSAVPTGPSQDFSVYYKLQTKGLESFFPKAESITFIPGFLGAGLSESTPLKIKKINAKSDFITRGDWSTDMAILELAKETDLPVIEIMPKNEFEKIAEGEVTLFGVGSDNEGNYGLITETLKYGRSWDFKWFLNQDVMQLNIIPFRSSAGSLVTVIDDGVIKLVGLQVGAVDLISGRLTSESHVVVTYFNQNSTAMIKNILQGKQGK